MASLADELLEKIKSLGTDEREKLEEQKREGLGDLLWIPNAGPQTEAYFSAADLLLYGGEAGGGKGLRPDALVLTPFGWKEMQTLHVGSAICATDGTVQQVIGRYDRGEQPLFRLKWSDGNETVCDADHVWLGWRTGKTRKSGNAPITGEISASKWTAAQIHASYKSDRKRKHRFAISPMSAPCAFNVAGENKGRSKHIRRSVPPYVLGVLLGDGCLSGNDTKFCSADQEIAAHVQNDLTRAYGQAAILSRYDTAGKCSNFRIPSALCRDAIRDLGLLGGLAQTKFIPRIYLLAHTDERLALLQGLMDTDGWSDIDGDCYFCSVSPRLADDTMHLARSLGCVVARRQKLPSYTHNGEKRTGKVAYTLRIKAPRGLLLFRLSRKAQRCASKIPQSMAVYLDSIEPAGRGETICIAVSNANSLFVTEGFITTHNSDLLLGLAFNEHRSSLIMRRQYTELSSITERAIEINGTRRGFSGSSPPKLITRNGRRRIDFGAALVEGDEKSWQGRPHDFLGLDEGVHFTKNQIRFLMGWIRTVVEGQRKRCVIATNPPIEEDGQYIVEMFAPWLDPQHPNPALPGELRYYVSDEYGEDMEVEDGEPIMIGGELVKPLSRTFIPASVNDNPYLANTDYKQQLDAMPEPYRSAFRDGNFMIARKDDLKQVIPTDWVRAAQRRWLPQPPIDVPMCAIGVDVARGGADNTVLAPRYDAWFSELIKTPGAKTPLGTDVAGLVVANRVDEATIIIDMGGGWGGEPYGCLIANGIENVVAYMGVNPTSERTKDGKIGFTNVRSLALWRFREALDPTQPGGSPVALPRDARLLADLTAARFTITPRGIAVESKEDLVKRLKRSTDDGDAVVMAWTDGAKVAMQKGGWAEHGRNRRPKVNTGNFAPRGRMRA